MSIERQLMSNVVPIRPGTVALDELEKINRAADAAAPSDYEYSAELELQQRKKAQEGHNNYASRMTELKLIEKSVDTPGGAPSPLMEHPAMADSAWGQGAPPSLAADVLNNPNAIDELIERENELSPALKQRLTAKLGYTPGQNKRAAPTPSPLK